MPLRLVRDEPVRGRTMDCARNLCVCVCVCVCV
jgi:hypothetical protein